MRAVEPGSGIGPRVGAIIVAIASTAAGCVLDAPAVTPEGAPASIRVVVPEGERGSREERLPLSGDATEVTVDLEVLGADGEPMAFDGWVELRAQPGEVVGVETRSGPDAVGPHVPIREGEARGLTVRVARAFSRARLWAEDIGYAPAAPEDAACADGRDDDGDGAADFPADDGCRYANDDTEEPGSHAAGVSEVLWFETPSLADVQGRAAASPLVGRRVRVDRGEMIVTRVTTDGFYVSEIELDGGGEPTGAPVPWATMFVFSFNTPPFLRTCDRIVELSGSVGEFFGFTELNFPSWETEPWCPEGEGCESPRPCPVPEPRVLDAAILGTPDMEAWEAGLVRVEDAVMPTFLGPGRPSGGGAGRFRFDPDRSNCDLDGDGDVSLESGGLEAQCNDECAGDPRCSEWSQFVEFGQIAVRAGGSVVNVVARDAVPSFEPREHRNETFAAITGTLRHFSPLGAERGYILEPRCEADLVREGEPASTESACVTPRTGGPDDPM